MKGWFFIGDCSPAVRYSPDVKSGAAAAIRFKNSVDAQAASKMNLLGSW